MKKMRISALVIILSLLFPICTPAAEYIKRGEVADMLLLAADDYNPSLIRSDIIKGYEDGLLHEEKNVTRAEALLMLKRAFDNLPRPVGHNGRMALSSADFADIPVWAQDELKSIFDSGIAAGTAEGIFSPDDYVTGEQMELFIKRVYSLLGTNLRDDFYATVNKETLEKLEILPGNAVAGTLEDMQIEALSALDEIIIGLSEKKHKTGSREQKIADFYECLTDTTSRNEAGIAPIKPYLEKIDSVKNITELTALHNLIAKELCVSPFISFALTVDLEESSRYILLLETVRPLMNKEIYSDSEKSAAYINYLEKLLLLSGENGDARKNAICCFEFERSLANAMLDADEERNPAKTSNISSYNKISVMFPDFDLEHVLSNCGLEKSDRIMVKDMALAQEFSSLYNQSNLSVLKTVMKIALIENVKETLSEDFMKVQGELNMVLLGTEGILDARQKAVSVITTVMPEYISLLYVEKYFDESAKEDILCMTQDIITVFKKRIDELSWMDSKTKEKAKTKLDTLNVKIGYPDIGETYLDNVDIVPAALGGTYFSNLLAIKKEALKYYGSIQFADANHSAWELEPYEVNATYNPSSNDITLPAAILKNPLYDADGSYEENLGGIGFIIAHEITHAFDSVGAKFDEQGNVSNWWTDEDYKAFEHLCEKVVTFFDGTESVAAIRNNGRLTLNENIADLGAAACITALAVEKNLDLRKMYTSVAKVWVSTSTREYASYMAKTDTHSDGKIRINRVLVNLSEFYEAFDIKENDGMYIPPEERVLIW